MICIPRCGRRVSTQFLIFLISTCLTVYQNGKRYIFLNYRLIPFIWAQRGTPETDIKMKKLSINFVPTGAHGFRTGTICWSSVLCCFMLKSFAQRILRTNWVTAMMREVNFVCIFGECLTVFQSTAWSQTEKISNIKVKGQSALLYLF